MKYGYTTEIIEKPIDVGEGWELVPINSVSPVQPTDEFTLDGKVWNPINDNSWFDNKTVSMIYSLDCAMAKTIPGSTPILAFRRKKPAPRYGFYNGQPIDPGEGWEIVPEGEVLKEGDEYFESLGIWRNISGLPGEKARGDIGLAFYEAFRRRKQPADPSAFQQAVAMELERARKLHAPQNSMHEGYAVLMEEVDELWDEVRKKSAERDLSHIYKELVQIAAMAQRMAEDVLGKKGKP